MTCPLCHHEDSRTVRTTARDDGTVRRTRQCARCGHKWGTVELPEESLARLRRLEAAAAVLQAELK